MPKPPVPVPPATDKADKATVAGRIADAVLDVVGRIPKARAPLGKPAAQAARDAGQAAATKAAMAAGSLALPPGPLGWLTLLPELLAVWRIQSQLVADIAAIYGRSASLNREQMLYCLFKHAASQAVRDLVVRAGERYIVRAASVAVLKNVAGRIGMRFTERTLSRGVTRWLPVIGAVGVGAYAYYDTAQVARTAIELFEHGADAELEVAADGTTRTVVRR